MCIIAIKKSDVNFPAKSTLENCFDNNADGAGFMWADGGLVHYKKGLMTFEDFWAALIAEFPEGSERAKSKAVMMHFRIGTHGLRSAPSHTHPFPVVDAVTEMVKLEGASKYCLMHNGILRYPGVGKWKYPDGTTNDKGEPNYIDPSDTMDFAHDIVFPLTKVKSFFDDKAMLRPIFSTIGSDKVVILRGDGRYLYFGEFKEDAGVLYSNTTYSYKKYKYTEPKEKAKDTYTKHGRRSGYWDDYDDYDGYNYEDQKWRSGDPKALKETLPKTHFPLDKSTYGLPVSPHGLFLIAPGTEVEILPASKKHFYYSPKEDGIIAVRVQNSVTNIKISGKAARKVWAYQYDKELDRLYWSADAFLIAQAHETVEDTMMPWDIPLFEAAAAFYDTPDEELQLLLPPPAETTVPSIDPLENIEGVEEIPITINKEEKVAESA